MSTVYVTHEWPGFKHSHHHNEYRIEGDKVVKYKCSRYKIYDGDENAWEHEEKEELSWRLDDPHMPGWLKEKI